ncbi:MAG: ChrR family anti-sigma-E factor [Neptuniibacter sp.]
MNIKHHLDEATLVSYTAGSMSQAMALVVACHISICPNCRDRVNQTEAIGGMLLDNLDEVTVSEDALDQVLACLNDEPDIEVLSSHTHQSSAQPSHIPKPLQDCIGSSFENVEWKRLVPGVQYFDLPFKTERGGVSRLMRIAPGKSMLPHTHDGNELTLILQGSFSDEMGRFSKGDVADLDSDIEHQPLVDSNEECICLIATDAPLKFSTLLGKLVQPMTGF